MGDGNSNQEEVTGEDALALLVGADAKYKTVEDLAKATLSGQQHISTLESENANFRDNESKATHMEDILKAINEGRTPPAGDNNLADQQEDNTVTQEPADIEALLEQKLTARDAVSVEKANRTKVMDALASKFGNRAAEMYKKAGEVNGVDLDKLAGSSPQAVINLVAGQPTSGSQSSSLPVGHQRSPTTNGASNPQSKAAIDARYAAGEITRHQKTELEFAGLEALGPSEFWNR